MYLQIVFCILATAFVVVECQHNHGHQGTHNDYTNSTEIDCMNHRSTLISSMMNSTCKPHYRHVPLKPMPSYEFHPSVVSVKRCDGHCPGNTCVPTQTQMISIPVRSTRRNPDGSSNGMCALVEVEEHVDCRCMCQRRETDCNRMTQVYMPHRCACVCRDQESKRQKCEMKPGQVWDDDDCTCNCTAMDVGCTSGQRWSRETCECILAN